GGLAFRDTGALDPQPVLAGAYLATEHAHAHLALGDVTDGAEQREEPRRERRQRLRPGLLELRRRGRRARAALPELDQLRDADRIVRSVPERIVQLVRIRHAARNRTLAESEQWLRPRPRL